MSRFQVNPPRAILRLIGAESVGATSGSILVLDESGAVQEGALAFGGKVHDHTAEQLTDTYERGLAGWGVERRQAGLGRNTRGDPRRLRRAGPRGGGGLGA